MKLYVMLHLNVLNVVRRKLIGINERNEWEEI